MIFKTDCIGVQLIPLIIQDQFYTIQNLQRYPISQTNNWPGTFFAVSYSKPALESFSSTSVLQLMYLFMFSKNLRKFQGDFLTLLKVH